MFLINKNGTIKKIPVVFFLFKFSYDLLKAKFRFLRNKYTDLEFF